MRSLQPCSRLLTGCSRAVPGAHRLPVRLSARQRKPVAPQILYQSGRLTSIGLGSPIEKVLRRFSLRQTFVKTGSPGSVCQPCNHGNHATFPIGRLGSTPFLLPLDILHRLTTASRRSLRVSGCVREVLVIVNEFFLLVKAERDQSTATSAYRE